MQRVTGKPAVRKAFAEDDARPIGQVVLTFDNPAALGGLTATRETYSWPKRPDRIGRIEGSRFVIRNVNQPVAKVLIGR